MDHSLNACLSAQDLLRSVAHDRLAAGLSHMGGRQRHTYCLDAAINSAVLVAGVQVFPQVETRKVGDFLCVITPDCVQRQDSNRTLPHSRRKHALMKG